MYLQSHVPDIIPPDMWPPNSPDLNPVDYGIWESLSEKFYRHKIRDINHLRDVLVQAWYDFPQNEINTIINQFRKRLRMVKEVDGKLIEQFFLIFSFYVSCVHLYIYVLLLFLTLLHEI